MRRLGVLIRQLPVESALVRALHPVMQRWTPTDLLADVWAVLVLANSEKGSLPDDFDHPVRAEMVTEAKAEHKRQLKEDFKQRKGAYAAARRYS